MPTSCAAARSPRTVPCWPPPATTERCGCGKSPTAPSTQCSPATQTRWKLARSPRTASCWPLATGSDDRTVRLWHVADGTEHAVLAGHTSWVHGCAFSPDGTLLATSGNDGTVRLWRITDRKCHCAIRVAAPLGEVAWHPAGTLLCAVGGAGAYLLAYRP